MQTYFSMLDKLNKFCSFLVSTVSSIIVPQTTSPNSSCSQFNNTYALDVHKNNGKKFNITILIN